MKKCRAAGEDLQIRVRKETTDCCCVLLLFELSQRHKLQFATAVQVGARKVAGSAGVLDRDMCSTAVRECVLLRAGGDSKQRKCVVCLSPSLPLPPSSLPSSTCLISRSSSMRVSSTAVFCDVLSDFGHTTTLHIRRKVSLWRRNKHTTHRCYLHQLSTRWVGSGCEAYL